MSPILIKVNSGLVSKDNFELHGFTFVVFNAFLSEESASYLKARKNQFQNREQQRTTKKLQPANTKNNDLGFNVGRFPCYPSFPLISGPQIVKNEST